MTDFPHPTMSIVIPAHNEEAVIGRCLQQILDGALPGEMEIIVACNGCTDRTAKIASSYGPDVRVVATTTASKIAALNLGDQAARAFPRFYIDADVIVSITALRQTAELLRTGKYLAASPAVSWDLSHSSLCVRAFYAVWNLQPYFDNGRLGAGLYAVSEQGHERIGPFPMITADDEYVRRSFTESERATAAGHFTVTPPRTLRDLIKIKTRSRRGTQELVRKLPNMKQPATGKRGQLLWRVACRPWLWLAAPVYAYVVTMTSFKARQTLKSQQPVAWERDLSSRTIPVSR